MKKLQGLSQNSPPIFEIFNDVPILKHISLLSTPILPLSLIISNVIIILLSLIMGNVMITTLVHLNFRGGSIMRRNTPSNPNIIFGYHMLILLNPKIL